MKWLVVQLGTVLKQYKEYIDQPEDRTYPKLSVKLYGRGVELDAPTDGSTLRMKRHQLAKPGQVILSEIWGKKGAIGLVPPEGDGALCTSHFFLFDIDESKVLPGWLNSVFRANYLAEQLDAKAFGTTGYAAVRPGDFLGANIPLPPLAEQQRIVAKIERVAGKVEEARGLRASSMSSTNSLLRIRLDQLFHQFEDEEGSVTLETACISITDGDHITPRFTEQGVKFIFVGNVSSGTLHFDGCKYVAPEYFASISALRRPRRGDVLYSAVGATLGIPALVDTDEEFCFQRHIAILKPNPTLILSRFLWYLLQSGRLFSTAWANTTGSAQPTVPLKAIRKLPIVLPPLEEQQRVIDELDRLLTKINRLRQHQSQTAAELDALLPAVLDRAFRGEL